MEVRILGPLEVLVDGQPVDLGGARQQTVLAVLALAAGQVVPTARLIEALYDDDPPGSAKAQVQICVSALRRLLPGTIITRAQGYLLAGAGLDLDRFTELSAASRWREALGLWRGAALSGLDSRVVRSAADRLDERRISLHEQCLDAELDAGRHHELVAEITGLVEQHPLRERLRGQLMLALHRSGRQAEALEVYRQARRTLIDELGLEPGEALRRLEQAILTEAQAQAPAATASPRLLPAGTADFTGRSAQVAVIERVFAAARTAVPVVVVTGRAGIGKTTLAVHAAHLLAARFPDGQLFADLHGLGPQPVGPGQVLERFLRALGVPGTALPDDLDERAERYRDLLAGRRALVVLDNVADERAVLPLLPGTPDAAVLVTSRSRLTGLPGAVHVDLDVFDEEHSLRLLTRIAGPGRIPAASGTRLADLCEHLPLALRIAGARLSARRHWTVEHLVERLADETRRLDELNHGSLGIRAGLTLTYDNLTASAQRLFRRLALLEVPAFSGWVSAPLLDMPLLDAQDVLEELVEARLVEATGSQYRFHDLIRVFARERLAAEEQPAGQDAALRRFLGGLLVLAEAAHRHVYGSGPVVGSDAARWPMPDSVVAQPRSWFEAERPTLVAGVRQAARAGLSTLCWSLTLNAVNVFEAGFHLDDWRVTHRIALAAARQAGDQRGEAAMLWSLGSLAIVEQRFDDARRDLGAAEEMFRAAGEENGLALSVRNFAFTDVIRGDLPAATARFGEALVIFRRLGELSEAAYVLHNLAQVRVEAGDPAGALALLPEALALTLASGSRRVEAQVRYRTGEIHLHLDDPDAAADAFTGTLAVAEEIGDRVGQAYALHGLGAARLRTGDRPAAEAALHRALGLATTAGERLLEARVRLRLGELGGEPARDHLERALRLFRDIGATKYEQRARDLLAIAGR